MGVSYDRLKFAGLLLSAIVLATATAVSQEATSTRQERTSRIYLTDGQAEGRLLAFDPATGDRQEVLTGCDSRPRISPDRKAVAYTRDGSVWVRDLRDGPPRKVLGLDGAAFGTPPVWSPDGSQLIVSLGRRDEERDPWRFTTVRVNADGSGKKELRIPPEDGVQDWSSDGRWLVTTSSRGAEIGWQLYVMRPNGTGRRQITEGGNPFYTRFSPDGRSVLYSDGTTEERRGIWVVDLEGKNRRRVLATGRALASACWSPDGNRIAVVVFAREPAAFTPDAGRLIVMDRDGSNSLEFPLHDMRQVDMPDWR